MLEAAKGSLKVVLWRSRESNLRPLVYKAKKKNFPHSCCLSYFYKYSDSILSENKDSSIRIKVVSIIHATLAKKHVIYFLSFYIYKNYLPKIIDFKTHK